MTRTHQRIDLAARLFLFFAAVFLVLFGFAAHAQGAAAPIAGPDLTVLAQQAFEAVRNGQWWILVSIGVSLLTWALRAHVFEHLPGKAGIWFTEHPLVGAATPFVLSAIGGLATALESGTPFSAAVLVGEIIKVGAGAITAFVLAKKVAEASVQGAVARGEVSTPTAAVALLQAGPQPVAPVPAAGELEAVAADLLGKPKA